MGYADERARSLGARFVNEEKGEKTTEHTSSRDGLQVRDDLAALSQQGDVLFGVSGLVATRG